MSRALAMEGAYHRDNEGHTGQPLHCPHPSLGQEVRNEDLNSRLNLLYGDISLIGQSRLPIQYSISLTRIAPFRHPHSMTPNLIGAEQQSYYI